MTTALLMVRTIMPRCHCKEEKHRAQISRAQSNTSTDPPNILLYTVLVELHVALGANTASVTKLLDSVPP